MGTTWKFTNLLLEKQEIVCNVGFGLQFWRSAIHTAHALHLHESDWHGSSTDFRTVTMWNLFQNT